MSQMAPHVLGGGILENEKMENDTRNQMCFDKYIRDGAGVEHVIYQSKFSVCF